MTDEPFREAVEDYLPLSSHNNLDVQKYPRKDVMTFGTNFLSTPGRVKHVKSFIKKMKANVIN